MDPRPTNATAIRPSHYVKPLLQAAAVVVVYSFLFWFVTFQIVGRTLLRLPIGYGAGTLYPVFFLGPLIASLLAYYLLCIAFFAWRTPSPRLLLHMALLYPAATATVLLVVCCPMTDPSTNFLQAVAAKLFG